MANNYMALVGHCMHLITNQPGGVSWSRLLERVNSLGSTSRREKTQVFKYLKERPTLVNNDADDMSETIFMLKPDDAVTETSSTTVSVTAAAKKERLAKYNSLGVDKTMKAEPLKTTPEVSKVVNLPNVGPAAEVINHPTRDTSELFQYNSFYNEDEVLAEMAYHVGQSEGHGITLTALRMSVPEFSECTDDERFYLINKMRNRYGIQFYTKQSASGKIIKVLALRRVGTYISRPEWFMNQHREVRRQFPQESSSQLIARTSGSVTNNAMAEAFAKLNPTQLFATQAGSVEDEHDEDEDDSMYETDGDLPEPRHDEEQPTLAQPEPAAVEPELEVGTMNRDLLRAYTQERPSATLTVATAAPTVPLIAEQPNLDDKASGTLAVEPAPVTPAAGVSKQEVTQAADTLRLIAAQLEAQANANEALQQKKARFDALLLQARQSSVDIQAALNKHNALLDNLESAANDLTSL